MRRGTHFSISFLHITATSTLFLKNLLAIGVCFSCFQTRRCPPRERPRERPRDPLWQFLPFHLPSFIFCLGGELLQTLPAFRRVIIGRIIVVIFRPFSNLRNNDEECYNITVPAATKHFLIVFISTIRHNTQFDIFQPLTDPPIWL